MRSVVDRRRVGIVGIAVAAALLAAAPAHAAGTAPAQFIGKGTTYWEYMGNDGNGNLVVDFDTTEPGGCVGERRRPWPFSGVCLIFLPSAGFTQGKPTSSRVNA